jgi:hypothetical protein
MRRGPLRLTIGYLMETDNQTEEEVNNITDVITSDDISKAIVEGAEIYSQITETFIKEFVFYDKTLYEWATDLMVEIPNKNNLDGNSFRGCLIELANNIQIASNYYSVASSMADGIAGGNSIKKSDVMSAIVNNYSKRGARRPAGAVIEKMAESYMSSTVSASVAAKIVKNFWRQRLDTLIDIRKVLEQVGMSLNVETKWTNQ